MALSQAQPLTTAQAATLRAHVFGLLRSQVPLAHLVVMGEAHWSPTQARVFAQLLDKCIPDLPVSRAADERAAVSKSTLTRGQLADLAAGASSGGPEVGLPD